jgi:hypothetical protein
MLPELFDIFREVNGMPKVPGRTPWQPSLTLRRIAMMLAAAMPMLINIVISLTYILSGRGKWLMAVAQIASLALLIVIGITVLSALKRPLYLEMEHDQLDWLTSLNADENAPWHRLAARLLREAVGLTLLGLVPVLSAVTCTAAIIRTTRILQIANSVGLPPAYRRTAQIIRIVAAIILGVYGAIVTFLPFFSLRSAISPPVILQP